MIIGAVTMPHPPIALKEIGEGEELKIQETVQSCMEVAKWIAEVKPDTIVLLSPHAVMYKDYFNISDGTSAYGSMSQFSAPEVSFKPKYDKAFTDALTSLCHENEFPAGNDHDREVFLDHGTMVPLYFINQFYKDYELVRIGLSGETLLKHYEFGTYIKETAKKLDRKVVIVASGDMSHCLKLEGPYGFKVEGVEYDQNLVQTLKHANFMELFDYSESVIDNAMSCGHRSYEIMAGCLDGSLVDTTFYSYQDTFGVGYGVFRYVVVGEDQNRCFLKKYYEREKARIAYFEKDEDAYIKLARMALQQYLEEGITMEVPRDLPEEMYTSKQGVFVSIYENHNLRGCIGSIEAKTNCVAEEIIRNAIASASKDLRFAPVTKEELPFLEIVIDVIGGRTVVESLEELNPQKYGVIARREGQMGMLLPKMDGVDTVAKQVRIAKAKGKIHPKAEDVVYERFEVKRHEVSKV